MSKIDTYREAKERAERVRKKLMAALGRLGQSEFDKLYATLEEIDKHFYSNAIVRVHASYGYYDIPSRPMDEDVAEYMVRALNDLMPRIAERAIELAEEDCEKARREAEEEAREVLREISTV